MKLPEDYEENNKLTPLIITSIIIVSIFILIILGSVLFLNRSGKNAVAENNVSESFDKVIIDNTHLDTEDLISKENISPQDFDFWDLYPKETNDQIEETVETLDETINMDPSTDGKHTLVEYSNGDEEWLLISPYLPKHNYDFTKLVCQSNIMKYYEDGKQISFIGTDISKYQTDRKSVV